MFVPHSFMILVMIALLGLALAVLYRIFLASPAIAMIIMAVVALLFGCSRWKGLS